MITISKYVSGRIIVSFPYDPNLVAKVRTIDGRKWHKDKNYWSFPDTDGTLEKILEVFKGKEIHIDPALKYATSKINNILEGDLSTPVPSPFSVGGQSLPRTCFVGEGYNFEDLRRELLSKKYSYKTVKSYLYFNKDFLTFMSKSPIEITDTDIKDYLFYLAEEKEAATSTINQAINALKFYYGTMLKKKFLYEIKRPRKVKKLPVVLSKEEVAKILGSVDNLNTGQSSCLFISLD